MKLMNIKQGLRISLIATMLLATPQIYSAQTKAQAAVANTSKIWGKVDGISFEGMVQGPSTEVTPLQIACVFEYTDGDIFNSPPALPAAVNGMVHLDKSLNGIITDLRKSGKFAGHTLETLLITPPSGTIGAKKLLLIGLGDRNKFTPELIKQVAGVGMEEALRMGVTKYAFATDLKDAGVDSPLAEVAGYCVTGAVNTYRTHLYLKDKKMSTFKPIEKITLLAGTAFFTGAGKGITDAIAAFDK